MKADENVYVNTFIADLEGTFSLYIIHKWTTWHYQRVKNAMVGRKRSYIPSIKICSWRNKKQNNRFCNCIEGLSHQDRSQSSRMLLSLRWYFNKKLNTTTITKSTNSSFWRTIWLIPERWWWYSFKDQCLKSLFDEYHMYVIYLSAILRESCCLVFLVSSPSKSTSPPRVHIAYQL